MNSDERYAIFEGSQAGCPMMLIAFVDHTRKALSFYGLDPETKELFYLWTRGGETIK